jgi:hypothetical protein
MAGRATDLAATVLAAATTSAANDDAAGWCVAPVGAGPLAPQTACERARLNEVALAGPAGARWVELHVAPGGPLADLRLRFVAADGAPLALVALPPGRAPLAGLPLGRDGVGATLLPQLVDGAVQLVRGSGELLDVYGFGALTAAVDAQLQLPLSEGTPGPPQVDGEAAQRTVDGVDSDDNAGDFQQVLDGTPGALNAP